MNNSKLLKKVDQIVGIKGDQSQIHSREFDNEDFEVMQSLKENFNPQPEQQKGIDEYDVILPVQPNLYLVENTNKPINGKPMSGTVSPYKGQKKEKSGLPIELEFTWKNITVTAKPNVGCLEKYNPEIHKPKILLNNVSGKVKSGEMLAIIGSSGAGKTTLLNFLSGKIESGGLEKSGQILLNNQLISPRYYDLITSYVMQDDVLEQTMTPLEILLFTAKMKLNLSLDEIERKVHKMIIDLNIYKCRNTRIGNALQRGVSGGERKRTSIGVELISDPKIIFLDEPTTGLDSYNAYELIVLLRKFAFEQNRLVIFTIHQPCSEIYELLDNLNILAQGKTIYFGDKDEAYDLFNYNQLPVPDKYNPFEYFMEITTVTAVERSDVIEKYLKDKKPDNQIQTYDYYIGELAQNFVNYKGGNVIEKDELTDLSPEIKSKILTQEYSHGICYEFFMLFARCLLIALRNKMVVASKIGQSIIVASLVSILWNNVSQQQSGIQDRVGLIFLSMANPIFGSVSAVILTFSEERKVIVRERTNNLYSIFTYYISKIIMDLPHLFIGSFLFGMIIFLSCRLNEVFTYKFFIYLGLQGYVTLAGQSFGYFLGTLAKTQESLAFLNPMVTVPFMVLSGFFTNNSNFAPYLLPFYYLSPFRYGFETFVYNEFVNNEPFYCNLNPGNTCKPLNLYTFPTTFNQDLYILAGLICFYHCVAITILYFTAKIKI